MQHVIELGSGTGVVGVGAEKCGATDVVGEMSKRYPIVRVLRLSHAFWMDEQSATWKTLYR